MNSLSWLIYFADVIPNLIALPISVLFGLLIFTAVGVDTDKHGNRCSDYPFYALFNGNRFHQILVFVVIPILILMIILVPSRLTIYLIAASEVSEQMATSEKGSAMLKDISDIIEFKLDDIRKELTDK